MRTRSKFYKRKRYLTSLGAEFVNYNCLTDVELGLKKTFSQWQVLKIPSIEFLNDQHELLLTSQVYPICNLTTDMLNKQINWRKPYDSPLTEM